MLYIPHNADEFRRYLIFHLVTAFTSPKTCFWARISGKFF